MGTKAPEAPGAETAPQPKPTPGRKKRYSYFEDGKDYLILAVQRDEATGAPIPNGPLVLIPDVPRFESAAEAMRWIRQSGAQLQGMKVSVVRMMHSVTVVVENKPQITVNEDKRFEREVADEK